MATSKSFLEFVTEQLSDAGEVTTRPMMGEYLVYFRGKLIGDICDDRLLVKITKSADTTHRGSLLSFIIRNMPR